MKRLIPLTVMALLIISGCVVSSPQKNQTTHSRPKAAQQERARQAFDELDGRPSTAAPATATMSVPAPIAPPSSATRPSVPTPSEETHLMVNGYGQSRPEAIRRAKAELSNTFQSRIESDISSITRVTTDSAHGSALTKSVRSKIRVASSVDLEGVEVVEVTKKGREYMAVVAIHRARSAEKWRRSLAKITTRIRVEEDAAQASPGKLTTLKHLNNAMALFIERETLISRLRVIGAPVENKGADTFESLVARLQAVKTNFRIAFEARANGQGLTQILAQDLTKAGFFVGGSKNTSDAILRVSLTLAPIKNNNPHFKFVRAVADVSIIDPTSGKIVGHLNESQRGAHLSRDEAGVKAVKKLSGTLSKKIVAYFN